jgi:hypothetical protein
MNEKLLIVDEYFQVAHDGFEDMELAFAAARKHRCRIWLCCVGGMRELVAIHRDNLETILEGCGMVQWLTAKGQNAKILSERCGDTERYSYGKTLGTELMGPDGRPSNRGPSVSESRGQVARKLLLPHEAEALGTGDQKDDQIVFFGDVAGPVRMLKANYRDIPELAKLAGTNPYYEDQQ